MNTADLVPLDIIVSDIANKSGDREFRLDSKGYYMAVIQEAMQELSIDTLYHECEKVFELENGCLKLEMPAGAFNLREVYAYSGTDCDPKHAQKIWWKRIKKFSI